MEETDDGDAIKIEADSVELKAGVVVSLLKEDAETKWECGEILST